MNENVRFTDSSAGASQVIDSARVGRGQMVTRIRAGGLVHEAVIEPRCKVCQSQYRSQIETLLLEARGYRQIIRLLPPEAREGDEPLNERNIAAHVRNGHLPAFAAIHHAAVQDRAAQLGRSLETLESTALDYFVVARAMMDRYFATLMADPHFVPSHSEIMPVLKMFAEIDAREQGQVDTGVYNTVFAAMLEAVKAVAPDAYDQILYRVNDNPVVRGIVAQRTRERELAEVNGET